MDIVVSNRDSYFLGWARQFVAADPQRRAMIELRGGALQHARTEAVRSYELAAARAGQGGRVIVSVGHGGADEGAASDTLVGMVDLAPDEALRLQLEVVRYHLRSSDETNLRRAAAIGDAGCRSLEREARRGGVQDSQQMDLHYCRGVQTARPRLELHQAYVAVGESFARHGVSEVVLLTCRVGNAQAFLQLVARQWRVRVTGYERRVCAVRESARGLYRVYLEGDDEGRGTNRERGRTELPDEDMFTAG